MLPLDLRNPVALSDATTKVNLFPGQVLSVALKYGLCVPAFDSLNDTSGEGEEFPLIKAVKIRISACLSCVPGRQCS